ncbi:MAG TPA: ATP-binding protein, partial [Solirubrobacterales bacterium]|nr:ATP-binding protein [Solirubrobacterales bacterium]
ELSRLINDLRPASLERLGLAGALRALAEEYSARGGFVIETEIEIGEKLRREEERAVYRLVQEALNNVLKHASAANVSVSGRLVDHQVRIAVKDDGCGFDPDSAVAGRGLLGMRERIELLGGEIELRSQAESGTEVTAFVPVNAS